MAGFVAEDQMGRSIVLPAPPCRIVSLVPSQTELLHDLGLGDAVVGITKFCVHPETWFRSKTRIGGTKMLNVEKIRALKPDLIIGNKEENQQQQIEALMQEFPVWMSDIKTLDDALDMIRRVGALVGRDTEAQDIASRIAAGFQQLELVKPTSTIGTAYFIWRKPYMAAGTDTFIHDMLLRCGWSNAFDLERYPEISPEMLAEAAPRQILLSSEPYPFGDAHIQEFQVICPQAKVIKVDGEMFSWYGSRLLEAPEYFKTLMHETAPKI